MKYLITGSTGFIGQKIIEKLLEDDNNVVAIVRPNYPNRIRINNENLEIIACNLSNISDLPLILKARNIEPKFEHFIHLGWQGTTGEERNSQKTQLENVKNSLECLKLAERFQCQTFFFSGSQAEYGNIEIHNYNEQKEKNRCFPETEYSKAKLQFGKKLLKSSSDLKKYHGRIFSVYGPKDQPNSLINLMLQNLTKKDGYMALGPCEHDWNFTFSEDIAKLILNLTSSKAPSGIYNLASHDTRPLKEFVNTILFMKDWSGVCQIGARQSNPASDIPLRPNIKKLEQYVQIEETPFVIGMQKTIEENYNLQLKKSDKITGSVGRTK